MRIVLTMVGIALGIAIAVVAGVYGWQQYQASRPAPATVTSTLSQVPPSPAKSTPNAPTDSAPKPANVPPAAPTPSTAPAPSAKPAAPLSPAPPPAAIANKVQPAPSSPATPPNAAPEPGAAAPAPPPDANMPEPGEEEQTPGPAETSATISAENLAQLTMGMSEDDVARAMGKAGVTTPEDQLSAYTPDGWYEVRWPNADGSYVAARFDAGGVLVYAEPFNLPGAEAWYMVPAIAVPNWLNTQLRANNMPVRVPAVTVLATQPDTYQFRGMLTDANGQVLGSITGAYYVNDPAGEYTRAMEGTYEYTMPDGTVDADTFQFSE